ncbi:LysR family transcriptional regulator [Parenemella sanctibonifatiensis]|uniref:LysR family transcriptional regulator n=1 Tax=Parenemella sanctibonifatiensis TaxID=2016505 RepID=A0A255EAN6_9ACTN|nr:LysR family transcriptional regulator [Parenemella sanctibonifatiensis]OYN88629.1 LysR family transcriptional regulator [Parenemella sanctibonifatiensis]
MESKLLECFVAVTQAGSFSGAARRLGITQPAVSMQIKSLEQQLGVRLFLREGGGVRPTAAGVELLGHAESLLAAWQHTREDVRDAEARASAAWLRLASFPTASARLVAGAVTELVAAGTSIEVVDAEPPHNYDLVRTGHCVAAVSFTYPDEELPTDLESLALAREEFVLLLPERHALAGETGPVQLSELAEEPWIVGCPTCRHEVLQSTAAQGFTPDLVCSTDDVGMTFRLVAAGTGVALRPALNALTCTDGVTIRPVIGGPERTLSLVWSKDRPVPEKLRDALVTSAAELAQVSDGLSVV